jgi:hypothetical protein
VNMDEVARHIKGIIRMRHDASPKNKIIAGLQDARLLNQVAAAIEMQMQCGPAKAYGAAKAAILAYETFIERSHP